MTHPTIHPIRVSSYICGANTVDTLISNTAKKLWGVDAYSLDATPVYVKLYDKATAPAETDTPKYRHPVPSNATAALGAGSNKGVWPHYVQLVNGGLGLRVTTGVADNNTGALTANEVVVNVFWSE